MSYIFRQITAFLKIKIKKNLSVFYFLDLLRIRQFSYFYKTNEKIPKIPEVNTMGSKVLLDFKKCTQCIELNNSFKDFICQLFSDVMK